MPGGDISKYTRLKADGPYPEPKVAGKSVKNADILLKDYAGAVSELTAVNLYIYQHMSSEVENIYKDYAELIGDIAIVEMKHLELLGETIKLLGVKPAFFDSVYYCGKPWNAYYVNYKDDIKDMLMEDIKAETQAIENYKYHISLLDDRYIVKLIERIIMDEQIHLKYFKEFYKKYNR